MADKKLIVSQDKITAVADAIREKTSTTDTMTLDEMPEKISSISGSSGSYTKPKLPDPIWYLDYENNKLHIYKDIITYIFGDSDEKGAGWVKLTDNDVEIPWTDFSQYYNQLGSSTTNSSNLKTVSIGNSSTYTQDTAVLNAATTTYRYKKGVANTSIDGLGTGGSIYDIPLTKGKHVFKIQYKAYNKKADNNIFKINIQGIPILNSIGSTFSTANYKILSTIDISDNPFTDSNVITLPEYTINEYNITLSEEGQKYSTLPGGTSGLKPSLLSYSGTLAYSGYSYPYTVESDGSYPFTRDNKTLTSTCNKVNNGYSWAKISFTLDSDQDITLSCKSYGESSYDYGLVSQLDQELTKSNSDDGSSGSTKVLKNFKGASSANFVDVSFGTVSAGDHFFTIKYKKDGSGDNNDDNFVVVLPWERTAVDTGYYLPSTITVTDADTNETITDYTYDPYTGDFTIPMTHSWNMTAVASTLKNILDKVSYNMNYDTGIMTLSSTGTTSYIYSIDDGEEVTTTGDIDLTSLSDKAVHTITSMAEADGSRPSGKTSYKVYKNMSGNLVDIAVKTQDFIQNMPDWSMSFSCIYNNQPLLFLQANQSPHYGMQIYNIFTKELFSSYTWDGYVFKCKNYDILNGKYTGTETTTSSISGYYHTQRSQLGKYVVLFSTDGTTIGGGCIPAYTKRMYIINPLDLSKSTSLEFKVGSSSETSKYLYIYAISEYNESLYIYCLLNQLFTVIKMDIDDSSGSINISTQIIAAGGTSSNNDSLFPRFDSKTFGYHGGLLFSNINNEANTFDILALDNTDNTAYNSKVTCHLYIGKNFSVNTDIGDSSLYDDYNVTFPAIENISYDTNISSICNLITEKYIFKFAYFGTTKSNVIIMLPYSINDTTKTAIVDENKMKILSLGYNSFANNYSQTSVYHDSFRGDIVLFDSQAYPVSSNRFAYAYY